MQFTTTTFESYGEALDYSIMLRTEELFAAAKDAELELLNRGFRRAQNADGFPFEYEIEDIREMDEVVDERAACARFDLLRRSQNGRELLALWKARTMWREANAQPQDAYDGFVSTGMASAEAEMERRLHMHDSEFEFVTREPDDASPEQYEAWDKQEAWLDEKTREARTELIRALVDRGVQPKNPTVIRWVEKRMKAKSYNQMRAYKSCTYILRRGFYTGFNYEGWNPAR
jgi:hypothetical protein